MNPPILDSGEKKLLSTGYMHREVMCDFHQYWNHIGIYNTIEKMESESHYSEVICSEMCILLFFLCIPYV